MHVSIHLTHFLAPIPLVMWTLVYALQIHRGVKDRTFAMPLIALSLNISWEFYFSFLGGNKLVIPWFLLNVGVFATALLYGREDFDAPLIRAGFRPGLVIMLLVSFGLIYGFVPAFSDKIGELSASFLMIVYSTSFIALILRRNSVKGQSIYIGLAVLIGDATAYPTMVSGTQPNVPIPWMKIIYVLAVSLHLLYVALFIHVARRDGVPVWKRI